METETEIKVSTLPASIHTSLAKNFPGYKINEASKIESVKNGKCFEAEFEKGKESYDVLFSQEGKMLNKTKSEIEKDEKAEKK